MSPRLGRLTGIHTWTSFAGLFLEESRGLLRVSLRLVGPQVRLSSVGQRGRRFSISRRGVYWLASGDVKTRKAKFPMNGQWNIAYRSFQQRGLHENSPPQRRDRNSII